MHQILLQSAFTCRQTVFNPSLSLCAGSTSQLLSNLVSEPKKWNSPPPLHQIDDSSPLSHQMVRAFSLRWLCMSRSVENPSLGLYLLQKTSGGQRHRNTESLPKTHLHADSPCPPFSSQCFQWLMMDKTIINGCCFWRPSRLLSQALV